MNAIVIEHVPVAELPEAWQARLGQKGDARVTVRIEAESDSGQETTQNPLFGMWLDREDLTDVAGHVRRIRAPRFGSGDDDSGS